MSLGAFDTAAESWREALRGFMRCPTPDALDEAISCYERMCRATEMPVERIAARRHEWWCMLDNFRLGRPA